jgi:hypothetical protein
MLCKKVSLITDDVSKLFGHFIFVGAPIPIELVIRVARYSSNYITIMLSSRFKGLDNNENELRKLTIRPKRQALHLLTFVYASEVDQVTARSGKQRPLLPVQYGLNSKRHDE